MSHANLPESDLWPRVRSLLPPDLDQSAAESKALCRSRQIANADALIRILLAYAVSDLSLKDLAAWAASERLGDLSGPALFYRVRDSAEWLEGVLAATLQDEVAPQVTGLPLRLVDATVLTGPGATGTDWRVHARIDPWSGRLKSVEVTDQHGGEKFGRHPLEPNEIIVGDRAYATARGLAAVESRGALCLARLNPHTIRLCTRERTPLDPRIPASQLPAVGGVEQLVSVPIPPERRTKSKKTWATSNASGWVEARVIAGLTLTNEVIYLITTAPADLLSTDGALVAYRARWQVELLFKRYKSLLHLDALPTREGPTARSWILTRLLAAVLAERLASPLRAFSPWGYSVTVRGSFR